MATWLTSLHRLSNSPATAGLHWVSLWTTVLTILRDAEICSCSASNKTIFLFFIICRCDERLFYHFLRVPHSIPVDICSPSYLFTDISTGTTLGNLRQPSSWTGCQVENHNLILKLRPKDRTIFYECTHTQSMYSHYVCLLEYFSWPFLMVSFRCPVPLTAAINCAVELYH